MENDPTAEVLIGADALATILAHAERSSPVECFGVVAGVGTRIVAARPVATEVATPTSFLADCLDLARAEEQVLEAGLSVLGYYHSHPSGSADPSVRDTEGRPWPDLPPFLHLIAHAGGIRAFDTRTTWRAIGMREVPARSNVRLFETPAGR